MNRFHKVAVLAGALIAVPQAAHASDAFWNQSCTNGGWTFNTCASAWVTTSGANQVSIRIWNLAGLPGSNTFANAAFTAIGLSNLGSGVILKNLLAYYPNGSSYSGWSFATGGGGIPGPVGSNGVKINGVGSSIFSQYANSIAGSGSPAVTQWGGSNQFGSGYVMFTFNSYKQSCTGTGRNRICVDLPIALDLTNVTLGLHVQNGPSGQSTGYECTASNPTSTIVLAHACSSTMVTPEPMTVSLLATGLVGLGVAQFRRRRRQSAEASE